MNATGGPPEAVPTELPSGVTILDAAVEAAVTTGDGTQNTGSGVVTADSIGDLAWDARTTDGRDGGARFEVRV